MNFLLTTFFLFTAILLKAQNIISEKKNEGSFAIVNFSEAAEIVYDNNDDSLIRIAAQYFQKDIEMVSGQRPRAVRSEMPSFDNVDLFNIPSYMVNGETGEQLIELVKLAMENKRLLVFLFHGVGGEHGLNVSLKAHNALLEFLQNNLQDVWVAPMLDIANYIKCTNTIIQ